MGSQARAHTYAETTASAFPDSRTSAIRRSAQAPTPHPSHLSADPRFTLPYSPALPHPLRDGAPAHVPAASSRASSERPNQHQHAQNADRPPPNQIAKPPLHPTPPS